MARGYYAERSDRDGFTVHIRPFRVNPRAIFFICFYLPNLKVLNPCTWNNQTMRSFGA
jgi:hypothetical protein